MVTPPILWKVTVQIKAGTLLAIATLRCEICIFCNTYFAQYQPVAFIDKKLANSLAKYRM
jgi:hypothetical protein